MDKTRLHRFVMKIRRDNISGCWEWDGAHFKTGYGAFNGGDRIEYAHRLSFTTFVGPIPDGFDIDHLCRNRGCLNPEHLEPVPPKENLLRGLEARGVPRNTCKRGHARTDANFYTSPKGMRNCRKCARIRNHEYKKRIGRNVSFLPKYQ